jgi:hypothetical protein
MARRPIPWSASEAASDIWIMFFNLHLEITNLPLWRDWLEIKTITDRSTFILNYTTWWN